jgi:hypothetical protein
MEKIVEAGDFQVTVSHSMSQTIMIRFVRPAFASLCLTAIVLATSVAAQAPKAKPPKAGQPGAAKTEKRTDIEKFLAEKEPPAEPGVDAILATKPTMPEECVRAARTLVDLDRADLAKGFLKKVLDAKLTRQQLADLGQEVGSPTFFELADLPTLQPEAKQLGDAVAAAVKAKLEDSKRIDALIQQLQDPSAEKRLQAIVGLQEASGAALGPLVAVLADPARAAEYANVRAALAEMGRDALPPLVAMVEGADPKAEAQAIEAIGGMKDARVAFSLLRPCLSDKSDPTLREAATAALKQLDVTVPSRADAVRLLVDDAKKYYERHIMLQRAADGKTELWRWDAAKRQCVAKVGAPADAARAIAARRARDAYALAPQDASICLLYLATMLERAAYENGLDRPLDEKTPAVVEARQFGVKLIEEVLQYAMVHDRAAGAAAAARLLGQIGKARELLYRSAGPAPLVEAVRSPDRRLRMAALEAIIRLQPAGPFAGSSYVLQALGFFVGSSGFRHALVAAPSLMEARELAGMFVAAGYETDTYLNGKELVLAAAQSPDYEFAMIDVTIDHPVIGILLQQLRHDPRTASLRVGLVARDGHFDEAEHLAGHDPLSKAFARPHDSKAFRWQLDQLATLAPQEFVGIEARQRQAAVALDLLAELGRSSSKLYDLRSVQQHIIAAVYNPKLAVKAVGVLADVNSAESQRTLVDVASRNTLPLAVRKAAVKAFRQNTQLHGILLTSEEIRRQYQRYNESEKLDAATQHVLALVLDCLEVGVPQKK